MANKYHGNLTGNGRQTGGQGMSNKASGSSPDLSMNEKTAAWPGLPGKQQPKSRSGGAPTTGHCGPFYVKKSGL
jgi:hypothetical protein